MKHGRGSLFGNIRSRIGVVAFTLALSQVARAELPISTLTDNNPPWFVAARCLGAMLVQPEIERNGEPELLTNIIATDPQFAKRSQNYPGSFLISPTPVGKIVGPIEAAIYSGARDITLGLYKRDDYNRACKQFAYGHD